MEDPDTHNCVRDRADYLFTGNTVYSRADAAERTFDGGKCCHCSAGGHGRIRNHPGEVGKEKGITDNTGL